MIRRVRVLGGATCIAALSVACGEPALVLPSVRNVVLISIDTLRADHLGCYGNTVVETPHIDRLAREGVLFEAHASSAPSTLCSHTSLMTGTYPHTHGTPRNGFDIPMDNVMLAEVLQDSGFDTAAVIGAFPLRAKFHFDQGFDHFEDDDAKRDGAEVNQLVRDWFESREDAGDSAPFFLFVHYWDAHYPYDPPAPYDRMYRSDSLRLERSKEEIEEIRARHYAGEDESERSVALRGLYAGGVSYVDSHVGELLALLEAEDALESSLIVLTSDHGESMDEHWEFWDHGESNYETSIHTPLILRLPGAELAGTRHAVPVSNVDVMPTILELVGLQIPRAVEGLGLASMLRSARPRERPPVFSEGTKPHTDALESEAWTNARKCRSIRSGRWKLIHRPIMDTLELYDLETDPMELANLLGEGAEGLGRHAERVNTLGARLRAWSESVPTRVGDHDRSEETQRQLEALGYFENQ